MKELHTYRERMLTHWQEIVPVLQSVVAHIPEERWHAAPPQGGWTCHQVLAHLRDIEAHVIAPSIHALLQGQQHTLPPCPDDARWIQSYRAAEAPQMLLQAYVALRADETGALMRQGDAPPWNVAARHPQFGVRTLQWWVEASLQHARWHVQILQRQAV